jgi:hypothetical protein
LDFIIRDIKAKNSQVVQGMDIFMPKIETRFSSTTLSDTLRLHQASRFGRLRFLLLFFGFFYLLAPFDRSH